MNRAGLRANDRKPDVAGCHDAAQRRSQRYRQQPGPAGADHLHPHHGPFRLPRNPQARVQLHPAEEDLRRLHAGRHVDDCRRRAAVLHLQEGPLRPLRELVRQAGPDQRLGSDGSLRADRLLGNLHLHHGIRVRLHQGSQEHEEFRFVARFPFRHGS